RAEDHARDPASPIRVLRRCALRNPQLPGSEVLNEEREGRREDRDAPLEPDPVRASATTRRRRARDDLLECEGIRAEVIGEQREVGESAALRRDLPPAMAHRAVEVREGHDLEVAAVGERYERVVRESVGVLAARRDSETAAPVIRDRRIEIASRHRSRPLAGGLSTSANASSCTTSTRSVPPSSRSPKSTRPIRRRTRSRG